MGGEMIRIVQALTEGIHSFHRLLQTFFPTSCQHFPVAHDCGDQADKNRGEMGLFLDAVYEQKISDAAPDLFRK